jgi:hypothetical protein
LKFDFLILEFLKFFLDFLPEENFGDFYKIKFKKSLLKNPAHRLEKQYKKVENQISFILSFLRQ